MKILAITLTLLILSLTGATTEPEAKPAEALSNEEQLFVNALSLTENLAVILESVKDNDSAALAAKKIEKMIPTAAEIKQKAQAQGVNKMSKEERLKLMSKYGERMRKATSAIILMSKRLNTFPAIEAAIKKIKAAMN
jgi:hypothetical protein